MRYLYISPERELSIRERPIPKIQHPDDVLIKISYASICNYDLMVLRGDVGNSKDGTIGHEASGVIISCGSNVKSSLRPGTPVTLEVYNHCMLCDECRNGKQLYCTNPPEMNFFMCEYIILPQQNVYPLPGEEYLLAGCLTEPLVMAMNAVKKANIKNGSSVAIIGCGAMGQIILQLIMLNPVSTVVVVDTEEKMRKLARKSGAHYVIDTQNSNVLEKMMQLTNGRGFDAVIEASGSKDAAKIAFPIVARGGSVVYFSLYGLDFGLEINMFQLYWKDATIQAVCVPSNTFLQAIQLLPRLHLEDVITAIFPFDQAPKAFLEKASGKHAKVMMKFD